VTTHRAGVAEALDALEVDADAGAYRWFGECFQGAAGEGGRLPPEARRDRLVRQLTWRLYIDFYAQGRAVPSVDRRLTPAARGRADLRAALDAANAGRGCREPGWRVLSRGADAVTIARDGITIRVPPQRLDGDCLVLPKGLPWRSPGHYLALGDRGVGPDEPLRRLYWNLTPAGAAPAMAALTSRLNAEGVPFSLKMLDDSSAFTRCDAGVLYVCAADGGRVRGLALEAARALAGDRKDAVPALTRRLAPGLSEADDPGDESFGVDRCRLIAEGAADAWVDGVTDAGGRLARVEARFAARGLSLDAPYREPRTHGPVPAAARTA
jgi:hypothetical protein